MGDLQEELSFYPVYTPVVSYLSSYNTPDIAVVLSEGLLFTEALLSTHSAAGRHVFTFAPSNTRHGRRLQIHVTATARVLQKLASVCGIVPATRIRSKKATLEFDDVVSSFLKYKVNLAGLVSRLEINDSCTGSL